LPNAKIVKLPLSDGGDGTIKIPEYHLKGMRINLIVNDPLFRPINASYLYMDAIKTAFIEMAEASGIALLKLEERNCFHTTTLGTGDIIVDVIKKGAKTIILGIGGSATNYCGIGMATALGYKFEDKNGVELSPIGRNLSSIKSINTTHGISGLKSVNFKVACDVSNPLFGINGCFNIWSKKRVL